MVQVLVEGESEGGKMKQRSVDEVLNKLEYNIVNSFFKDKIPFKKTTKSELFQIFKRELEKTKIYPELRGSIEFGEINDNSQELYEAEFINVGIDKSIQVIAKLLGVAK